MIPVRGYVRTGDIITDGPHAGQLVLRVRVHGNESIRFYDLATGTIDSWREHGEGRVLPVRVG